MKFPSKLAGVLCCLFAVSSCAVAKEGREVERSLTWTFVEVKSGASSFLRDDGRFVVAEESFPASFCPPDSPFHCFSSQVGDFAIPRANRGQDSWVVGGRVYCVVRRFHDVSGVPGNRDGALLIFSRKGVDCGGSIPFDIVAVYSMVSGLRQLSARTDNVISMELISSDRAGFGVR